MNELYISVFTATATTLNFSCGFRPDAVLVTLISGTPQTWRWYQGMGDGTALLQGTGNANVTAVNSYVSTLGVSLYAGSSANAIGFTLGGNVLTLNSIYAVEARRSGDGAQH